MRERAIILELLISNYFLCSLNYKSLQSYRNTIAMYILLWKRYLLNEVFYMIILWSEQRGFLLVAIIQMSHLSEWNIYLLFTMV